MNIDLDGQRRDSDEVVAQRIGRKNLLPTWLFNRRINCEKVWGSSMDYMSRKFSTDTRAQ